ncbi:MAG: putative lipid II flippase FtsW [Candidatus Omnitrophica bacterium]|nr:putative lipid II flippase FtsW [Candidatus Omnitrophota bacterium]
MMMRNVRLQLCMTTMTLICIGVVMIYSSSSIYALERYTDSLFFLKRHLSFIAIGFAFTLLAMVYDYKRLRQIARPLLAVSFVLLLLVLVPGIGREVAGARRWFRFKFLSFQPSEFAGLALIIYAADFIARKEAAIKTLRRGLIPAVSVLGAMCLLILAQPDLGTTIALGIVVFLMLFVAGIDWRYLVSLVGAAGILLYALIVSEPYRLRRIVAFLNPWADPRGSGFQIIQSQIALGSGGIFGAGLGHSKQKLFYLPAAHTDFIFSIIGEELGLIGTAGVIILFIVFIRLGVKVIKNAPDRFGYFLSLGLVSLLAFKAIVNIGVSCGVFPTKGLPLPFISYGGSSFVFDMISVGLLLNIARVGESGEG